VPYFNEIPQAANCVVGGMRHRVRAADRVVGAELLQERLIGWTNRGSRFPDIHIDAPSKRDNWSVRKSVAIND
jgi:hypothetical protein